LHIDTGQDNYSLRGCADMAEKQNIDLGQSTMA